MIIDWNWFGEYGFWIVGGLFLIFIFWKPVMKLFKKPKIEKEEEKVEEDVNPVPQSSLFIGDVFDIRGTLKEQKNVLENELENMSKEGKKLVEEEKELQNYIQQQKKLLTHRRQNLGLRWQTAKNNLQNVNQMMENQEKLDKELKDEKFEFPK